MGKIVVEIEGYTDFCDDVRFALMEDMAAKGDPRSAVDAVRVTPHVCDVGEPLTEEEIVKVGGCRGGFAACYLMRLDREGLLNRAAVRRMIEEEK